MLIRQIWLREIKKLIFSDVLCPSLTCNFWKHIFQVFSFVISDFSLILIFLIFIVLVTEILFIFLTAD